MKWVKIRLHKFTMLMNFNLLMLYYICHLHIVFFFVPLGHTSMEETCWQPSQTRWLSAPGGTRPLQQHWHCRASMSCAELRLEIQLLSNTSQTSGLTANLRQLTSESFGQQILSRIRDNAWWGSFQLLCWTQLEQSPRRYEIHTLTLTHYTL